MPAEEADGGPIYLIAANCGHWLESQNVTFHFAMVCFVCSFIVPCTHKWYDVSLRTFSILGVGLLMIWDALYWCTYDVFVWGALFIFLNAIRLVYWLYESRAVKFESEFEDVYTEIFEPFNVTRAEFKALITQNCKFVDIMPGDRYAVEGLTTTESRVSLLISGSMSVVYKGTFLHKIKERQFIDSPEWEGTSMKRNEIFQVTIQADDPCFYMSWNREKLEYHLSIYPKVEAAFCYLRGKDAYDKVYQTAKFCQLRQTQKTGVKSENKLSVVDIRTGLAEENPDVIYHPKK